MARPMKVGYQSDTGTPDLDGQYLSVVAFTVPEAYEPNLDDWYENKCLSSWRRPLGCVYGVTGS